MERMDLHLNFHITNVRQFIKSYMNTVHPSSQAWKVQAPY